MEKCANELTSFGMKFLGSFNIVGTYGELWQILLPPGLLGNGNDWFHVNSLCMQPSINSFWLHPQFRYFNKFLPSGVWISTWYVVDKSHVVIELIVDEDFGISLMEYSQTFGDPDFYCTVLCCKIMFSSLLILHIYQIIPYSDGSLDFQKQVM